MSITHILVLTALSLALGRLVHTRWRGVGLLVLSLLALYALQPATPVRSLDFWLPTASITLTLCVWAALQPPEGGTLRPALPFLACAAAVALLLALSRYLDPLCCLTASRPPQIRLALAALALAGLLVTLFYVLRGRWAVSAAGLLLLMLFIVLKTPSLAQAASAGLRLASGQDAALASPLDLRWLGFSYLAFRLLGVLRDAQAGRGVPSGPGEFMTYALFYPSLSAGPIDRLPRFLKDFRSLDQASLWEGGQRIMIGLFKKFALADSLAIFALNPLNAGQSAPGWWSWVLLYAYALRIYFDFSGYTDIALGLAHLVGIRLPENFDRPYLKTNLTAFWNAWHITLAGWFRAYLFNPLTRSLRQGRLALPVWGIILIGQVSVMLLIGLWHGVAWNFAIWGLWHAAGLFIHNRWSDFLRPRLADLDNRPRLRRAFSFGGWLLTFHYVTLGWIWFALPTPSAAWDYILNSSGKRGSYPCVSGCICVDLWFIYSLS